MGMIRSVRFLVVIVIFRGFILRVSSTVTTVSPPSSTNTEEQLYTALSGSYGERVRPISDSSDTMNISIGFDLMKLVEMNEPMQRLEIAGALTMSWTDYKLTWNPMTYGFLTHISLPTTIVWIPDIGQSDSLVGAFDLAVIQDYYNVMVNSRGQVHWWPGGTFVAACALDITYFPFDTQTCTFTFKSWTQFSKTIQLVANSPTAQTSSYTTDGQWDLKSAATTIESTSVGTSFDGEVLTKSAMVLTLTLGRKQTYYMVNMVSPCILISILVLVVFYIPPDAGEKISFGITILLAFSVFQLLIADSLPKSSEHVALLSVYLIFLMSMSTFSVIMSVFILNAHHMCIGEERLPRWAQKLLFGFMAKITCFTADVKDFRTQSESIRTNNVTDDDNSLTITDYESAFIKKGLKHESNDEVWRLNLRNTRAILGEVRKVTNKMEADEKQSHLADEWKMAARIIDRFLLIVCAIIELVMTIVCLAIVPAINA